MAKHDNDTATHEERNGDVTSMRERVERAGERVLSDDIKQFRTRLWKALQIQEVLRNDEREMETFTTNEIEKAIDRARNDLIENIGISEDIVNQRVERARNMRDEDQMRETFAPHRHLHNRIREKLQSDEQEGMSREDFYEHVRSTSSPVDDWLLHTYRDESDDILATEDDGERERKCSELAKRIRREIGERRVDVPQHLGRNPADRIAQYVFLLNIYGGYINTYFMPLPKEVVNGIFGHMPDDETMQGIYEDKKRIQRLPDAPSSSIRVIVGGKEVQAYGADAVLRQIEEVQKDNPGARIVHVHQLKDAEVIEALRKMGEGRKIVGKAREKDVEVEVIGKENGEVDVRGIVGVDGRAFIRNPMKYLSHSLKFVEAQEKGNGSSPKAS